MTCKFQSNYLLIWLIYDRLLLIVDDLRWKSPENPTPWNNVRGAKKNGPLCGQVSVSINSHSKNTLSYFQSLIHRKMIIIIISERFVMSLAGKSKKTVCIWMFSRQKILSNLVEKRESLSGFMADLGILT